MAPPAGSKALAVLKGTDRKDFASFLGLVDRPVRHQAEDLFMRLAPLPDTQRGLLALLTEYSHTGDDAVPEAELMLRVGLRLSDPSITALAVRTAAATHSPAPARLPAVTTVAETEALGDVECLRAPLQAVETILELRRHAHRLGKPEWFPDLLDRPPERCDWLVRQFQRMPLADMHSLLQTAQPMAGGMLQLAFLLENPEDGRDLLRDLTRDDKRELMLLFGGRTDRAAQFNTESAVGAKLDSNPLVGGPHRERMRDAGADVTLELRENAEGVPELMYIDRMSEQLGVRPWPPLPLDTTRMRNDSRRRIYENVSNLNNGQEIHHQIFADKLQAMQAQSHVAWIKGKWWKGEAEQRKVHAVKNKILEILEKARLKEHRRKQAEVAAAEEERRRLAEEAKRRAREELLARTRDSVEKWAANDLARVHHDRQKRNKLAIMACPPLESDINPPQGIVRQRGGKSHHQVEWDANGLPISEAAAAHEFGTASYDEEDTSQQNDHWGAAARRRQQRSERRQQMQRAVEKSARADGLRLQCEEWRKQIREIEEEREARLERERIAREKALAERRRQKDEANRKREALRAHAAAEEEAAMSRVEEEERRVEEELEIEARERRGMAIEEARQCAIDRFWGLPTEDERQRMLREQRRRLWEARVADRRRRMIQVGEVDADTLEETEELRRFPIEP